ncbi:hypothetical protein HMPREF3226_00099 [Prevotella corporis]|uniref:Uncharacterized protein n=1 Tax=Prevotella corporis TaxID=28128 RepID=A0A133QQF9_9BACT|nr:hypothetical protein HMPREF3226_00099 [Prevotella corporis]
MGTSSPPPRTSKYEMGYILKSFVFFSSESASAHCCMPFPLTIAYRNSTADENSRILQG